jgi:hypothetical protein
MAGDETTEEMADAMNKAMDALDMPMNDEVDEFMPEMEGTAAAPQVEQAETGEESIPKPGVPEPAATEAEVTELAATEAEVTETDTAGPEVVEPGTAETETGEPEAVEPEVVEPQIIVEAAGSFIDRSHPTEGIARVLGDGSGQRFLRFEDFRTDNGPDLNVYLSAAPPDAPAGDFDSDFVDLGDLKGNVGAQNYEIPAGLDLDHYSTVAIWCVRFGVVFGVAELIAS